MHPNPPPSLPALRRAPRFWEFSSFSSTEMMFIVGNANISTSFVFKCLSRRNSCICLITQRLMNFTIKAKSVHFLHSTAAQLVTIHDANTEQRAWSRDRKCFEPLRIPMTSSLLLTFNSNWITWMSNEHCAALCAPTAAISQLFLSKLLRSRRRRVSLIRVLCLRPGAFLDRLPRESQSLVVRLGGIQFCKLLALSKLENCKIAQDWLRLFFRGACIAHTRGCWLRIHRAAKNLKRFSRKLETVPGGSTEKDKSVAMQFGSAVAGTKENITRVARRPLNGSFLRGWVQQWDVARQITAASLAAMERMLEV